MVRFCNDNNDVPKRNGIEMRRFADGVNTIRVWATHDDTPWLMAGAVEDDDDGGLVK